MFTATDITKPRITKEDRTQRIIYDNAGNPLGCCRQYENVDMRPRQLTRVKTVINDVTPPKDIELYSDGIAWKANYSNPSTQGFGTVTIPYSNWSTAAMATIARRRIGMTQDQLAELAASARVTIARHEQPDTRTVYSCKPDEGIALMMANEMWLDAITATVDAVIDATGETFDPERGISSVGIVCYTSESELIAAHPELTDAVWPSLDGAIGIVTEVEKRLRERYDARAKADGLSYSPINVYVKSPLEWQSPEAHTDLRVDCAMPRLTRINVKQEMDQRFTAMCTYVTTQLPQELADAKMANDTVEDYDPYEDACAAYEAEMADKTAAIQYAAEEQAAAEEAAAIANAGANIPF